MTNHAMAIARWAMPIFIVTTGTAGADPVFSINAVLSTPNGNQPVIGSQGTPIVDSRTDNAGIPGAALTATFGVVAKPGNLGSLSSVSALAPGGSINGSAGAISDVALDNITLLAPGVAAGTLVQYSINFQIGGSIVLTAFGASTANGNLGLSYSPTPGNGITLGTVNAVANSVSGSSSSATGIFSNGIQDVRATTPVETGFVDHFVFAEFTLATSASAGASPSATTQGQASAVVDFLDPFSFPTSGPVFNFFDVNGNPLTGVTADSSDGCIVDNRFLCGSAGAATPLPGALPLFASGLGALALLSLRRKRKAQAAARTNSSKAAREGVFLCRDVRFWPKADMS